MTETPNQSNGTLGKGKAFFDRADQVAETLILQGFLDRQQAVLRRQQP